MFLLRPLLCPIMFLLFAPYLKAETALRLAPDKIDFGTFPAKDKKEAAVEISNTSNVPVKIIGVRNTCSCAEVKIDKMEIQPQGSVRLNVTLLPEGIYGEFSKSIYIETDRQDARFISVPISGNSKPLLRVISGNNIDLGFLKKNIKLQQEIKLQAAVQHVGLGRPVIRGGFPVSATLTMPQADRFILKCELDSGNQNCEIDSEISIPVIKPEGWKPVTIFIRGYVGAFMQAIPASLKISNISEETQKKIRLRFQGVENPEIGKLKYNLTNGIEILPAKTSVNEFEILLRIKPGLAHEGRVRLQFDYPETSGATVVIE